MNNKTSLTLDLASHLFLKKCEGLKLTQPINHKTTRQI